VTDDAAPVPPLAERVFSARFAAGLILCAVGAAAFAIAFRAAISAVLGHALHAENVVAALGTVPWWARLLLPTGGGLVAGLLGRLAAKGEGGHGVSDVMEAVVLGRVRLSMRHTLLKSLGSWFAIATGGSLGREGPLIQFGGALGKVVGERLGFGVHRTRVLIAAGTAAGFASAYNTPLAAVLFVLEVVTGVVVLDAIVPALIATVLATALTRAVVGPGPIYGARAFSFHSSAELAAYAVLGVAAALVAQGFMRLLSLGERLFHRPGLPLPWRPALGGLLAGAFVAFAPEVAGNGYEPLNQLLDARYAAGFVTVLILAKCLATTASVSSGSPGGVFTPTLFLGGAFGALFGAGLHHVFGDAVGPPGGYALVGMAATTAASTHAPLMAAVMVFELSGDYAVVLPLILATALATGFSRALRAESVYESELRERGVSWTLTYSGRQVSAPPPP
jgi:CIC family chloride channel protein